MAKSAALDTDSLKVIEQLVEDCSLAQIEQSQGRFGAAMILSRGILELRTLLSDDFMRQSIMPLMNSPLGFMTDKPSWNDPSTYSIDVVRDCLIEAVLRGLYPTNNQFNIIAKRCYVALNGFKFLLKRVPSLTSVKIVPGIPKMSSVDADGKGGAVVKMECAIVYKEKKVILDREFAVKVNKGMGADAIIGKAQRKIRKDVWEYITGCSIPDGEAGDGDVYTSDGLKNVEAVDLTTGEVTTAAPSKKQLTEKPKVNNVARLKDQVEKQNKTESEPTVSPEKSGSPTPTAQGSAPSISDDENGVQRDLPLDPAPEAPKEVSKKEERKPEKQAEPKKPAGKKTPSDFNE